MPMVLRKVLLPDMFEPVMMSISPSLLMVKSLTIFFSSGMRGWPRLWAQNGMWLDCFSSEMISGKT